MITKPQVECRHLWHLLRPPASGVGESILLGTIVRVGPSIAYQASSAPMTEGETRELSALLDMIARMDVSDCHGIGAWSPAT